jgi:hypothetical protein
MQAPTINASITAYSTAVGPLSSLRNRRRSLNMGGTSSWKEDFREEWWAGKSIEPALTLKA